MRKLDNIAIVIFGVLMVVASPVCLWGSSVFNAELTRWQAAQFIQGSGELTDIAQDSDVAIVGTIPSDLPVEQGFALYERWERTRGVGESQRRWRETGGHKPTFELFLGEQGVTIQSARATLYNTQDTLLAYDTRLEGLAPGSEITVLGKMTSSTAPLEVQAEVICGGGRDACLKQFSGASIGFIVVTVALGLAGIGLIGFGLMRLRARPNA